MYHNRNIRRFFSYCPDSRIDEGRQLVIRRNCSIREKHAASNLVSYLNHVRKSAGFLQCVKNLFCILIYGLLQLFKGKIFPGLGLSLLTRICPIIGVMEVKQKMHSMGFYFFCHFNGVGKVTVAFCLRHQIRLIPDTKANGIDMIFGKQFKCIHASSVCQIKFLPTIQVLREGGNIHTLQKIHFCISLSRCFYFIHFLIRHH